MSCWPLLTDSHIGVGLAPTALMLRSRWVRVYSLAGHFGRPSRRRILRISRRAIGVGRLRLERQAIGESPVFLGDQLGQLGLHLAPEGQVASGVDAAAQGRDFVGKRGVVKVLVWTVSHAAFRRGRNRAGRIARNCHWRCTGIGSSSRHLQTLCRVVEKNRARSASLRIPSAVLTAVFVSAIM